MCSLKPVLSDKESPYPRICAHRGFHTVLPENSLPGIASAIVLGADEVEMDLWQTADNEAVIFHDTVLDRVTDETGLVTEKMLSPVREPVFANLVHSALLITLSREEDWVRLLRLPGEKLTADFIVRSLQEPFRHVPA